MWTKKRTVHPHIRGAYALSGIAQVTDTRFIPTYVGHTAAPAPARPRCPVHPHIRGAYCRLTSTGGKSGGSSPHTWGIQRTRIVFSTSSRFIPTYVGHTCSSRVAPIGLPVHPHIRGAYLISLFSSPTNFGSSPHTWGILCQSALTVPASRFIPTYVGHTGPK